MILAIFALFCVSEIVVFPSQQDIYLEAIDVDANDRLIFYSPHENEAVVNDYVKSHIEASPARYFVLRQAGNRHIHLVIQDQVFEVDPNRIFTICGAEGSVRDLNDAADIDQDLMASAVDRAVELGQFILNQFGPVSSETVWIALHNNTDGYEDDGREGEGTVSIDRYQMRLDFGASFLISVFKSHADEDDLFWTTKTEDHDWLGWHGYNSVLQNPDVAVIEDEDDGSLSVFAEMRKVRYLNIEAERFNPESGKGVDHTFTQMHMLQAMIEMLGEQEWWH